MKQRRFLSVMLFLLSAYLLVGCSTSPDASVLLREAKTEAKEMKSCSAALTQALVFTTDGARHTFDSDSRILYRAQPFALRNALTTQKDGKTEKSETYTVTEGGRLNFYSKADGIWQKTGADGLNTDPAVQLDVLRLLSGVADQKYVRETVLDSRKVHKLEVRLNREILRNSVETVAAASGMTGGSSTVVQALLDGAPELYGYCYIDASTGNPVRLEADLTEAAGRIFRNIDGAAADVQVSKLEISGSITQIGTAPAVALPREAQSASSVQAYG